MSDLEFLAAMGVRSFPTDENWLPNPHPPAGEPRATQEPRSYYQAHLEAIIAAQSAEIQALRQLLKSQHDRHAKAERPKPLERIALLFRRRS